MKSQQGFAGKKCGVIMTYYSCYELLLKELYFCM